MADEKDKKRWGLKLQHDLPFLPEERVAKRVRIKNRDLVLLEYICELDPGLWKQVDDLPRWYKPEDLDRLEEAGFIRVAGQFVTPTEKGKAATGEEHAWEIAVEVEEDEFDYLPHQMQLFSWREVRLLWIELDYPRYPAGLRTYQLLH